MRRRVIALVLTVISAVLTAAPVLASVSDMS